jgi:hypothetical protein
MIGFIIGLILGLIPSAYYFIDDLIKKDKSKPSVDKYQRRGIYNVTYNVKRGYDNYQGEVDIQYEVGEIECTTDMSKIEVISLTANQSRFNTPDEKKSFINQIDKSWVDSASIKWIESVTSERNKKIEKILGK